MTDYIVDCLWLNSPKMLTDTLPIPMEDQLELFPIEPKLSIPSKIGQAQVTIREISQILTPASGFIAGYDYTLNPYIGCQFGCAYCYAAFFVDSAEKRKDWGYWVEVKANAVKSLNSRRKLLDKKIYMSSVTDPYQPIEAKVELTRSILETLSVPERQPRLVIQTRSPFVTRDIDLFKRFQHIRVNVTVTTDSEDIRKRFEPLCPNNEQRLDALDKLKKAGIKTGACVTPMLPIENPEKFAKHLAELHADVYVTQPFKASRGPFAAGTREMAIDLLKDFGWTEERYQETISILRRHLPILYEGQAGFFPE